VDWSGTPNAGVRALLEAFAAQGVQPFDRMSVLQARVSVSASTRIGGPRTEVADVRDLLVEGRLPVRVYHPSPGSPLPLVVYFHGGGFVAGGVAVADRACRGLAVAAGVVVVSVEYRLSPETPFPGPQEDCVAAVRWAVAHAAELGADADRLVLAGDSAGATLAASTSRTLRDGGGPVVVHQLLVYPTLAPPRGRTTPSLVDNAADFSMTTASLDWFWDHHLAGAPATPEAAPLLATDLAGLPPTTLVVAEFDPLRDEGVDYANALEAAGVPVTLHAVPGTIHGFWWMAGALPEAAELTAWLGTHLRAVLA